MENEEAIYPYLYIYIYVCCARAENKEMLDDNE
jgi:hypothetical protein